MIVKLIRDNGRNPFKNAILAECLLERGQISIYPPYAYVEVSDWPTFCKCVIRAAAACSKDSRGYYFKDELRVNVTHENGREYAVFLRVNADLNGLIYGAVPNP